MGSRVAFTLSAIDRHAHGVQVLRNINLQLPESSLTAIIGPSGSGKTSLLRLLNRLDSPDRGTIEYQGRPISDIPVREYRRRVAFVFQTPVMFPGTVRDNLKTAGTIGHVPERELDDRVVHCLQLAEVDTALVDREAGRLSVGQRQRISIARSLMSKPDVLLLDEPTASLDPETADRLMGTIVSLSRSTGLTVVAVTHRLVEAKQVSDYAVMLESGLVVDAGPANDLFERTEHPRLRAFLSSIS